MLAPAFLAPLAWKAVQIGAVAALGAYAARRRGSAAPSGLKEIWRERALDDVAEGATLDAARDGGRARIDGAGRLRRSVRLGAAGPGIEFDLAGLMRLKLRRL